MSKPQPCPNIIDIEASGFGSQSYPIEIGVVKSNGERYCSLIIPDKTWTHWCCDAENLHGITRETLIKKGSPPREVCFELNEFLDGEQVFSDAWSHDQPWLAKLYRTSNIHPSFEMRAIEFILSEEQILSWDNTKLDVSTKHPAPRHRASNDAHVIQMTYLQCQSHS